MKYPEHISPEQLTVNASNEMMMFTAVLSIFIGLVLFYMGKKGQQMWMRYWGIGLVIASLALGYTLI